jgi:hypothetical protein
MKSKVLYASILSALCRLVLRQRPTLARFIPPQFIKRKAVAAAYSGRAIQKKPGTRDARHPTALYQLQTAETGSGVKAGYDSSHPSNPECFIPIQAVLEYIEAKKAAGQPFCPT